MVDEFRIRAREIIERLRRDGHPEYYLVLARDQMRGITGPKDFVSAYANALRAKEIGLGLLDWSANPLLSTLSHMMTPDQVDQAKRQAQNID